MLQWAQNGTVRARQLFRFDPNPREEGFDIAEKEPATADRLQERLLSFLNDVQAETVSDFPKKRTNRKPK